MNEENFPSLASPATPEENEQTGAMSKEGFANAVKAATASESLNPSTPSKKEASAPNNVEPSSSDKVRSWDDEGRFLCFARVYICDRLEHMYLCSDAQVQVSRFTI